MQTNDLITTLNYLLDGMNKNTEDNFIIPKCMANSN